METMLAHNVYFTLKDGASSAIESLVNACHTYLKDHNGIVHFSAGQLVSEHDRDVNIRDFQVGLHVVFKTKADHDAYQTSEKHHQFIDACKDNWAQVRVFDTFVR